MLRKKGVDILKKQPTTGPKIKFIIEKINENFV